MPTGYQIERQDGLYFLTFQVIDWVDIFTRKVYCDIVLDSLDFCRKNKGLKLWAYVIMSNHVHLIISAENQNLSAVIRDFKSHTAREILNTISEINESRRDWMLKRFEFAALRHKRNSKLQFWRHNNHAIELESSKFVNQKMAYIHENPIRAGFVESADEWMYSSQRNYSDRFSLIEIDIWEF